MLVHLKDEAAKLTVLLPVRGIFLLDIKQGCQETVPHWQIPAIVSKRAEFSCEGWYCGVFLQDNSVIDLSLGNDVRG